LKDFRKLNVWEKAGKIINKHVRHPEFISGSEKQFSGIPKRVRRQTDPPCGVIRDDEVIKLKRIH
jgi:hypothetical protein